MAVTNGITFLNGLKNTGTVQSGTITLDDGAYITNSSGVDQTFNKNLATIPNLAGKYASGYYQYVSADVSEDGKTLTLHYQPSAEVLTFVVDFGLPLNITPNDLGLENADAVTGLTCNTSKGTYGIFSSSGTTVTYTPNETIDGAESVVLTIHYSGSTVTKQIRVLPASVVYYEDSFATYDSSWSGTAPSPVRRRPPRSWAPSKISTAMIRPTRPAPASAWLRPYRHGQCRKRLRHRLLLL